MLTRMFAYFTLISYLVLGTVVVRFCMPESVSLSFDTSYFKVVTATSLNATQVDEITAPEMAFNEIKIPEVQVVKKAPVVAKVQPKKVVQPEPVVEMKVLAKNELPFHEPIKLEKIEFNTDFSMNLVAMYTDFHFEETVVAETEKVSDEISTAMASVEEAEPEFFEYPTEVAKNAEAPVKEVEFAQTEINKKVESDNNEVEVQDIAELMEPTPAPAQEVVAQVEEPNFFDYSNPVTTQPQEAEVTKVAPAPVASAAPLVGFDYSKAQKDLEQQVIPTVSKVTTHKTKKSKANPYTVRTEEEQNKGKSVPEEDSAPKAKKSHIAESFSTSISINVLGSDLNKLTGLQNFEVRFQDDLSEMLEDYGSGEVRFEANMVSSKMTRTATILKRGYVPTSTELILEEGASSVSIPLIESDVFNELMVNYERAGSVGGLLVELDDETEVAKLDVKFGDVVKLDGDFKRTDNDNFRYQLFVGVQAGNAMLSYHRHGGEVVSKIVHVHENEITYDANFYETVVNEKVRLYEQDLLAKENSPLIISGDQVKVFASNNTAKKLSNHTYKLDFGMTHLGGRRYLELNHQIEPVFVGIRDNHNVTVPSESFMRHVLSNIEGRRLGNRCLVQVNLTKKAEDFFVASESVASSLMTYTQVLDADGKFYDSLSDKTEKIIIVGESQGSGDISPDAKINIKIQYRDGSTQFLNSYCSPNTYLVEQL